LIAATIPVVTGGRLGNGRRRRLQALGKLRRVVDQDLEFGVDGSSLWHVSASASAELEGLIQHNHSDDGDDVEHNQRGDDDQSQASILLSNVSLA
jgi:hypothetical protein